MEKTQGRALLKISILGALCISCVKFDVVTLKTFLHGDRQQSNNNTAHVSSHKFNNSKSQLDLSVASVVDDKEQHVDDEADYNNGHVLHDFDKDILNLLHWEERSVAGMMGPNATSELADATCMPPTGVLRKCCLGSYSKGGGTTDLNRIQCAESLQPDALDALREHTRRFFQENALPASTNTSTNRNIMACDVCRIVDLAHKYNLTIALIGDSMQHQVSDGLNCELQRRNYKVTTEVFDYPAPPPGYQRLTTTNIMRIQSPLWRHNESVTIEFHRMYLLPLVTDDIAKVTAKADVLVLGFGLHWGYLYNNPHVSHKGSDYVKATSDLFRNVTNQGHVKLLVHRETSAQHFDADGGEFSLWNIKKENSRTNECRQMMYNDTSVGWREKAIRIAANESGHKLVIAGSNMPPLERAHQTLHEVVVLPYFNFTSQHYGMHPRSTVGFQDCTHYCSSPYIYYPLWRSLRLAMDRQYDPQNN